MQHRLHLRPTRNYTLTSSRNRARYAVLTVAVVATGRLWHSALVPLPPVLSKYGDNTLWALMVFVIFGFLLPRASALLVTLMVTLMTLTFSWAAEFSQLYHAPWLDAVRATIPGKLVLGNTFNWPYLSAYALGVGLGAWIPQIYSTNQRSNGRSCPLLPSFGRIGHTLSKPTNH
jgi:hypothetical protein